VKAVSNYHPPAYYKEEPRRRPTAELLTRDEVWRIAANFAGAPDRPIIGANYRQ
jgi:hypothetical protein